MTLSELLDIRLRLTRVGSTFKTIDMSLVSCFGWLVGLISEIVVVKQLRRLPPPQTRPAPLLGLFTLLSLSSLASLARCPFRICSIKNDSIAWLSSIPDLIPTRSEFCFRSSQRGFSTLLKGGNPEDPEVCVISWKLICGARLTGIGKPPVGFELVKTHTRLILDLVFPFQTKYTGNAQRIFDVPLLTQLRLDQKRATLSCKTNDLAPVTQSTGNRQVTSSVRSETIASKSTEIDCKIMPGSR